MNKLSNLAVALALLTAFFVSRASATSNFIYVANTGENTVSKIDITSNTEVARYATWFGTAFGPAPSRIARDANDNAYVLDRFFTSHLPVLLKIAPGGGTNTSSGSGLGAVLTMTDSSGDNHIQPGEITDDRILWASEIGTVGSDEGKLGRALCMDTNGLLWVGIFSNHKYYQVNPATGIMTGVSVDTTAAHNPYGCQVDMNGKLWSVNSGTSLAEIDTMTNTLVTVLNHGSFGTPPTNYGYNYSLSLYNDCTVSPAKVTVYLSDGAGKTYIAYDPQANSFSNPAAVHVPSIAVGVDSLGNIVSGASNGTGQVVKHSPTGAQIWNTGASLPPVQKIPDLHGVIIDRNDDIWLVDRSGGRVLKYGAAGNFITAVTVGSQPYTYGNPPPPKCGGTPPPTGCAQISDKDIHCLPNGDYSYTFSITNNSTDAMSQVLLTPAPGATFTLTPQLGTFSTPLKKGQSTTVTTTISHVKPGDKVCFFVSLMADKAPCCNIQVCVTMPQCGGVSPTPTVSSSLSPPLRQQAPRGRRRP